MEVTSNKEILNLIWNREPFMFKENIVKAGIAASVISISSTSYANLITSGESKGLSWTAQSLLVGAAEGGTGSFPPFNPFGNPLYHPTFPNYSGVVGMLVNQATGTSSCSGTLLQDRRSILTAAHCVSDGAGSANPLATTVFFQPEGGLSPAQFIYSRPAGVVEVQVTDYFVHQDYTGEVIDQNDIAILRLADDAPSWASSYGLYEDNNIMGQQFNVAGYGRIGGGTGSIPASGRLRQGNNTYDFAWGNDSFSGFFTDSFFGTADVEFSYVSDFDSGNLLNDASGLIADLFELDAFDLGLGELEAGVAPGDSGGPNFINDLISGVNSYGLGFGSRLGDTDGTLNSSFGELSGYVPTFIHSDFIRSNLVSVSTPNIFALLSLGLLGLFLPSKRRKN